MESSAVPASQTAREKRLKAATSCFLGAHNIFSHLALITHHTTPQCFLEHCASQKVRKPKKDGTANTAKKTKGTHYGT